MSTARDICRRALTRARVIAAGEEPSAEDASDALALLNDMMFGWSAQGVDIGHAALVLADTFVFFVPPLSVKSDTISALSFQGNWNASTNSPALASSSGTEGFVYKVSVAGSTALDDVTSWAQNDFAIFDGARWLKGRSSRAFEGGFIDMLAVEICNDHGKDIPPVIARNAMRGWQQIQACFIKPKMNSNIDLGLVHTPSRRFIPDGSLLE